MVITSILPYLPLLGMKRWLKNNTNIFNGFRRGINIYLDTFLSRVNSFKVIVIIPLITPIYPLITPTLGTNTRGVLEGFWYVFLCCLNNIMLKFSACYEFGPGLYEF